MPQVIAYPVFIQGKGWMSYENARKCLTENFNHPVWSDVECEIVDTCESVREAWELYQVAFGSTHRTYDAIRRRWNRSHQKVLP